MSAPKTKKVRIDDCFKKSESSSELFDGEVNNLLNLFNFDQNDFRGGGGGGHTSEDREVRKERGDRLLQLFREQPSLSSSASARRIEKNFERALIWDEITQKINKEFGARLEVLTVDKVKKLLTYYKKKEEGNFDNLKPLTSEKSTASHEDQEVVAVTAHQPIGDILNFLATSLNEEDAGDITSRTDDSRFLPLIIPSSSSSSSSTSSSMSSTSSVSNSTVNISTNERNYLLRKERHDCVVRLAEHYHQRMCFDNSSRSATVNAERHNMWIKITQQVNDRYAKEIGGLGVEQAKKLYSNCKRRRRIKYENEKMSESLSMEIRELKRSKIEKKHVDVGVGEESGNVHNVDDVDVDDDIENEEGIDEEDQNRTKHQIGGSTFELLCNIDEIIRNQDKDAEIDRLKMIVDEKNAKIHELTRQIEELTSKHKSNVMNILEEIKKRVINDF